MLWKSQSSEVPAPGRSLWEESENRKQPGETNTQTNLQTRPAFVTKEKGPIQLWALGACSQARARAVLTVALGPGFPKATCDPRLQHAVGSAGEA